MNAPYKHGEGFRFSLKADTPEACKKEIVDWLKRQSAIHGVNARTATRVKTRVVESAKSTAYFDAAGFIDGMTIEGKYND